MAFKFKIADESGRVVSDMTMRRSSDWSLNLKKTVTDHIDKYLMLPERNRLVTKYWQEIKDSNYRARIARAAVLGAVKKFWRHMHHTQLGDNIQFSDDLIDNIFQGKQFREWLHTEESRGLTGHEPELNPDYTKFSGNGIPIAETIPGASGPITAF